MGRRVKNLRDKGGDPSAYFAVQGVYKLIFTNCFVAEDISMDLSKPGDYQLNITPMKAYDRFEPNDNIQLAKIISAGKPIKGHVMDDADEDY